MTPLFGLSYRTEWDEQLPSHMGELDCFELILEQFDFLDANVVGRLISKPTVLHSVKLSPGSAEPPPRERLAYTRRVVEATRPEWMSVHMAITELSGIDLRQLTPVLFTEANTRVLADNMRRLQDYLGIQILLENITYYFEPISDGRKEWDVITEVVDRADCGLLLDLNNLYVNSRNLGYDPETFLRKVPLDRVRQIHLAGFEVWDGTCVDTHGGPTSREVLALLETLSQSCPSPMVIVERDSNVPPLAEMIAELDKARGVFGRSRVAAMP